MSAHRPSPRTLRSERELHALRLAVGILITMLRGELHQSGYQYISTDVDERMLWVRRVLAPLAAISPPVRHALRLLDPDRINARLAKRSLIEADLAHAADDLARWAQ